MLVFLSGALMFVCDRSLVGTCTYRRSCQMCRRQILLKVDFPHHLLYIPVHFQSQPGTPQSTLPSPQPLSAPPLLLQPDPTPPQPAQHPFQPARPLDAVRPHPWREATLRSQATRSVVCSLPNWQPRDVPRCLPPSPTLMCMHDWKRVIERRQPRKLSACSRGAAKRLPRRVRQQQE